MAHQYWAQHPINPGVGGNFVNEGITRNRAEINDIYAYLNQLYSMITEGQYADTYSGLIDNIGTTSSTNNQAITESDLREHWAMDAYPHPRLDLGHFNSPSTGGDDNYHHLYETAGAAPNPTPMDDSDMTQININTMNITGTREAMGAYGKPNGFLNEYCLRIGSIMGNRIRNYFSSVYPFQTSPFSAVKSDGNGVSTYNYEHGIPNNRLNTGAVTARTVLNWNKRDKYKIPKWERSLAGTTQWIFADAGEDIDGQPLYQDTDIAAVMNGWGGMWSEDIQTDEVIERTVGSQAISHRALGKIGRVNPDMTSPSSLPTDTSYPYPAGKRYKMESQTGTLVYPTKIFENDETYQAVYNALNNGADAPFTKYPAGDHKLGVAAGYVNSSTSTPSGLASTGQYPEVFTINKNDMSDVNANDDDRVSGSSSTTTSKHNGPAVDWDTVRFFAINDFHIRPGAIQDHLIYGGTKEDGSDLRYDPVTNASYKQNNPLLKINGNRLRPHSLDVSQIGEPGSVTWIMIDPVWGIPPWLINPNPGQPLPGYDEDGNTTVPGDEDGDGEQDAGVIVPPIIIPDPDNPGHVMKCDPLTAEPVTLTIAGKERKIYVSSTFKDYYLNDDLEVVYLTETDLANLITKYGYDPDKEVVTPDPEDPDNPGAHNPTPGESYEKAFLTEVVHDDTLAGTGKDELVVKGVVEVEADPLRLAKVYHDDTLEGTGEHTEWDTNGNVISGDPLRLKKIYHDDKLEGDGTAESPLTIASGGGVDVAFRAFSISNYVPGNENDTWVAMFLTSRSYTDKTDVYLNFITCHGGQNVFDIFAASQIPNYGQPVNSSGIFLIKANNLEKPYEHFAWLIDTLAIYNSGGSN